MRIIFPILSFVLLSGILESGTAQTPDTMWTYELLSQCYGSPACGDIDNDGYLEIVFGTYFDDEHAYALNAEDGSLLWRNLRCRPG
jgi:outer membrane protein assembly factor BamB